VIIPTYNYARFVAHAVQCAIEQTFWNREIIVVDDGSTDNTREVLASYMASIRYVYQENRGHSAALNTGIRLAAGRYIAFLDSDDLLLPDSLEKRVAELEAHPEVGCVYGQTYVIDGKGDLQPQILGAPELYPGQTFKSLLTCDFIPFPTLMVRLECVIKAGLFDETLRIATDWDFKLRASRFCQFRFIERPLAKYRVHGSNITKGQAAIRAMQRIVEKYVEAPDATPEVQSWRALIYSRLYTNFGLMTFAPEHYRESLGYFRRAVRVSERPAYTALRIAYLILVGYLDRTGWGAALVRRIGAVKQRLNYARAGVAACKY
jgi:glycosyltransferase involved in cell wall biosynthesis